MPVRSCAPSLVVLGSSSLIPPSQFVMRAQRGITPTAMDSPSAVTRPVRQHAFAKPTPKYIARPQTPASRPQRQRSEPSATLAPAPIPPVLPAQSLRWWLARSTQLAPEHKNGWVLAVILEEYAREEFTARACEKETFAQRMESAGLGSLLQPRGTPRQHCAALASAASSADALLDENAQRYMLATISSSLSSYASGLKCWAAFNDALGTRQHFPASETAILQFGAMFRKGSTYEKYLHHIAWAHRFLRLPNTWLTPAVKQAIRGAKRNVEPTREKLAIDSKTALKLIRTSINKGEFVMAALMAISRMFLLRVPSEGIPLEWHGEHSWIDISSHAASITLARRKNSRTPVTLTRKCCCESSGKHLCAVHWLRRLRELQPHHSGRLFDFTIASFTANLRSCVDDLSLLSLRGVSSHAFRRGMAQDILSLGGSLAVLLRAGDWSSSAYLRYVKVSQPEDAAIAQAVIHVSDSEAE